MGQGQNLPTKIRAKSEFSRWLLTASKGAAIVKYSHIECWDSQFPNNSTQETVKHRIIGMPYCSNFLLRVAFIQCIISVLSDSDIAQGYSCYSMVKKRKIYNVSKRLTCAVGNPTGSAQCLEHPVTPLLANIPLSNHTRNMMAQKRANSHDGCFSALQRSCFQPHLCLWK